ncbi:hypothetical protein C1646_746093 [Rhizophagus diaphanus]|nr:hypothetical protein C1646_746093 [Rhizophagus diaphanus] [Rhizophagus sp. MUCL 43196]
MYWVEFTAIFDQRRKKEKRSPSQMYAVLSAEIGLSPVFVTVVSLAKFNIYAFLRLNSNLKFNYNSNCYLSDEEPDQKDNPPAKESTPEADDNYNILEDMLSNSDSTTVDPIPEKQLKTPAESSTSATKPNPEPNPEPKKHPWKEAQDTAFNELFNAVKEL